MSHAPTDVHKRLEQAPSAFSTPAPGTPWWQTAKDVGAWTDRQDGDLGYVHFGSVEALRVYTVKIGNQVQAAEQQRHAAELRQSRAALAFALEQLEGWVSWKCPKKHQAEHTAKIADLRRQGGLA